MFSALIPSVHNNIVLQIIVLLLAVLLTGCSGGKGTAATGNARILIATCAKGDAFRDMLIAALESACDEQGIGHDTVYAEQSAEQQVAQVKEAKSQGYTAVICRLIDVDTALQVERAADGLPVIFVNNCPDEGYLKADEYIYVASNESVAGSYQAQYVLDKLSGKSEINVMILQGEKTHSATKGRTEAAKRVLNESGKKINYLFQDYADWSPELGQEYFEIFNSTGRTVDCVRPGACHWHDYFHVLLSGLQAQRQGRADHGAVQCRGDHP